jgi:hypothetical protein
MLQKAKQSFAVEAACQFLSNATKLLPTELIQMKSEFSQADIQDPNYIFAVDFLLLRAECEASCRGVDSANQIITYLLQRGRSARDRVRTCNLSLVMHEAAGDYHSAAKVR